MADGGLTWQAIELPFSAGLNTKADDRARPQPFLDIARDVQFDELGGLQTRYPFAAAAGSIFGGGTIANARRIVAYRGELVLFTSDSIYSWNAQLSKWVLRGTHLAVSTVESPTFVTPGDQINGDRAELAGTVVYAWSESTTVYAAALDTVTGSVLVSPTVVATSASLPRVIALTTKILLFTAEGAGNLVVRAIDPASPAAGITGGSTSIAAGTLNTSYDVVKVEGQDLAIGAHARTVTTSYTAFKVTPALAVTTSTKARTATVIAIATSGTAGTSAQVIRASGTNIQGDLLTTSTLADVFTAQAIGTADSTTINQITVAFSTTTSARAFWTSGNIGETSSATDFTVKSNTVTTANTIGSQATFRHQLAIASHAFAYNGNVYVWLAFASDSGTSATGLISSVRGQLQNTYFLYRDDALLVTRCVMSTAGGFAPSTGFLPGVALTGGSTEFSWCATSRRRISLGTGKDHTGFGSRSLQDVAFTFDSNAARRCAPLGSTLYITGGIPLQYDGIQVSEVGFLIYPWYFEPQLGAAGNLGAGGYAWKATMRWQNAQGEIDRSTTATGMTLTIAASKFVFLNYKYLNVTLKTGSRPPSIDMWRTEADAGDDAPFFLVTSQDPNAGFADNGFVVNVDTLDTNTPLPDNFADATLVTKEKNPENGAVLEYLAPPGASIIIATDTRIFLGGVAGDPDRVWYSRLRGSGEVASFHDTLTIDVPREGGDVTALAFVDDTLIVYRSTAIYALPGAGLDNLGAGQNYGPARIVSLDVGAVNHESVAIVPMGVVFKSRKGWYLQRGASVEYIGGPVSDFDSESVLAVNVVETQHQVRVLTASRMLVWDYTPGVNQWFEWTITDGMHACLFGGVHAYLTATGTRTQLATYTALTYGIDVETAAIKLGGLMQSATRCRIVQPLGEYRSAHRLRVRIAYNYAASAGAPTYVDDKAWPASPATVGGPLQVKHRTKRPICESIKVRLTALAASAASVAQLNPTSLTPQVATSGAVWGGSGAALVALPEGEAGNSVTISIAFTSSGSSAFSIDVRYHFAWSTTSSIWTPLPNNVGVHVACRVGSSPTVADLESAIAGAIAGATIPLADLDASDFPVTTIDAAAMIGIVCTGAFAGGAWSAPAGEALKLTSLGLEVGSEPGLTRRLPAAQQQ